MAEETRIIRLVIDSSKAVDGGRAAQRALEQIERSTSSLDSAMARMEQSLGRVGGMIKAHLALMLAEMAARLVETAKAAVEAVGGLDELAEQLGLTTKGLQALQFSGIQNGLKLEQLETGAAKFSQKIGEAANGSKEMIEALDHLGVRILDVDKTLRPTEDIMSDVARAILAIEDPARRAATSVEFFGKAGTRFQPVLQDIARGFGFMGEEARKGGALVDEHVVKRLDQLSDAFERGKLRSRAFFAEMAVAILDMADKAIDAYRKILAQQATRSSGGGYQWERDFQSWVENAVSNMAGVGAGVVEVFRAPPSRWLNSGSTPLTACSPAPSRC
jgi:DNA-binding phage protein